MVKMIFLGHFYLLQFVAIFTARETSGATATIHQSKRTTATGVFREFPPPPQSSAYAWLHKKMEVKSASFPCSLPGRPPALGEKNHFFCTRCSLVGGTLDSFSLTYWETVPPAFCTALCVREFPFLLIPLRWKISLTCGTYAPKAKKHLSKIACISRDRMHIAFHIRRRREILFADQTRGMTKCIMVHVLSPCKERRSPFRDARRNWRKIRFSKSKMLLICWFIHGGLEIPDNFCTRRKNTLPVRWCLRPTRCFW